MKPKKVLCVEDDILTFEAVSSQLRMLVGEEKISCVNAQSCFEAELELADMKNAKSAFDAIVFDGQVIGGTTIELIRKLAKKFKGPMIACSGDFSLRVAQKEAGCTHSCGKDALPEILETVLGFTEANKRPTRS